DYKKENVLSTEKKVAGATYDKRSFLSGLWNGTKSVLNYSDKSMLNIVDGFGNVMGTVVDGLDRGMSLVLGGINGYSGIENGSALIANEVKEGKDGVEDLEEVPVNTKIVQEGTTEQIVYVIKNDVEKSQADSVGSATEVSITSPPNPLLRKEGDKGKFLELAGGTITGDLIVLGTSKNSKLEAEEILNKGILTNQGVALLNGGMNVSSGLLKAGTSDSLNSVTINGGLAVSGTSQFSNTVITGQETVNGNMVVNGKTTTNVLDVTSNANILSLNVIGHAQVSSLGIAGTLGVDSISANKSLYVGQSATIGGASSDELLVRAQGTFTSNVDTTDGLDVTGSNFTVGGANFIVDNDGNLTMVGDLTVGGVSSSTAIVLFEGDFTIGSEDSDTFTVRSGDWELTSTATNTVAMTNGLNFDSNTFVIDPSSNRVGIGTSSPANLLHIASALGNQMRLGYDGQNYTLLDIGSDGAFTITPTNNATTTIVAGLVVNTDSLVVQDATGYVGIGTTNPTSNLSVSGDFYLDGRSTTTNQSVFTYSPQTAGEDNVYDSSLYINSTGAVADANLMGVADAGVWKFRVDKEGDVFIEGNVITTGAVTQSDTEILGNINIEGWSVLGDAPNNDYSLINGYVSIQATSTQSALTVMQDSTGGDIFNLISEDTEVFTVLNNGNVGIGASAPTNIFSLGNSQAQKIWIERTDNLTAGRALTLAAGSTINTGVVGDFSALSQTSRNWRHMAATSNGNIYAAVWGDDIYMQTSGAGDFNALSQTTRNWYGIAAASNGNVYAVVYGGDIYMQTNGTGDFSALSQTSRNWTGIAAASNGNIYAVVDSGDIYMQTNGTGDFVALSQTSRAWTGITVAPNGNVYAVVFGGDIYMQTNGTGDFTALSQTSRNWTGITASSNSNVYAIVFAGDVYMQTAGAGDFSALSQATRNWYGIVAAPNGNVYAAVLSDDIYMQTAAVGTSDLAGGDLILTSGQGKGAGASAISFLTGTTLSSGTTLQTLSEKMTILGSGKVGIGTTSPLGLLSLNAPAGQNSFVIGSSTATSFVVDEFGNVGIGTTSPSALLSVKGAGTTTGRAFAISDSADAEKFTVLDNGNVGIGTAAPGEDLHISGSSGSVGEIITVTGSGINDRSLLFFQRGGATRWDFGVNSMAANDNNFYIREDGSSSTVRLTVQDTTGNVGIGTTSPLTSLSVEGTAGTPLMNIASSTGESALYVDEFGKVGIGTGAPVAKLQIGSDFGGSTGGDFYSWNSGGNPRFLFGDSSSGGDYGGLRWDSTLDAIQLYTSTVGTSQLVLREDGNVGIGTSSPLTSLSVEGTAGTPLFNIASSTGASAFYVDEFGKVGIGTGEPGVPLHVIGQTGDAEGEAVYTTREVAIFANNNSTGANAGIAIAAGTQA
ncbi:beta strand repeat-containing protein, partial [Patescibacteria group bacterium]